MTIYFAPNQFQDGAFPAILAIGDSLFWYPKVSNLLAEVSAAVKPAYCNIMVLGNVGAKLQILYRADIGPLGARVYVMSSDGTIDSPPPGTTSCIPPASGFRKPVHGPWLAPLRTAGFARRLQEDARSDDCDCSARIANELLRIMAATGNGSTIGICRRVARSGSTLTVVSHRAACSRLVDGAFTTRSIHDGN